MTRAGLAVAVLLILTAFSAVALAEAQDPLEAIEQQHQRLFDSIARSVVLIQNGESIGSGFFVSADGLVLTNAHVVSEAKQVKVVLFNGKNYEGRIVERGRDNLDVALVKVALVNTPALELGGVSDLRVGRFVASVGHGFGGMWTFAVGFVSNIYPSGGTRPIFQTQIPLNPGSSGGPIFDRLGRVVGIVVAGIVEADSINFGIRSDVILGALHGLASARTDLVRITAPPQVAVFLDNQMIGSGPSIAIAVAPGEHEVFAVIGGQKVRKKFTYPAQMTVELK